MLLNLDRLYSVHLDPKDPRPYESAVFIPEGFNWRVFALSFFFIAFLWPLYHRMFIVGAIFFALTALAFFLGFYVEMNFYAWRVLQIGVGVMMAVSANDLRRDHLEKSGYVTSDVVIASSLLEAERRFFDRHLGHIETQMRRQTAPV
jgi:hypothetical protein